MLQRRSRLILLICLVLVILAILFINPFKVINEDIAPNNNSAVTHELIANNSSDGGSVEVIKNIGNPNGEKVAYIVGVHPLENDTHKTLLKLSLDISCANSNKEPDASVDNLLLICKFFITKLL